jgi:hypothetical protein
MQNKNFSKFYESLPNDVKTRIQLSEIECCFQINPNKRMLTRYLSKIVHLEGLVLNFGKLTKEYKNYSRTDYMYKPEAVALARNTTFDEATNIIAKFKANKATTKENFITRYGEIDGLNRYEKHQADSRRSSDAIRLLPKSERLAHHRIHSVRCHEYYIHRGLADSEDTAKTMANEFQRSNSGTSLAYYVERGISEDDALMILHAINPRKAGGYLKTKERYPDDWMARMGSRFSKYRKTINAIEAVDEYLAYRKAVTKFTNLAVIVNKDFIPNINSRNRENHLDHIFSVKYGFLNGIDPEVIGHWTNLRVITSGDNCSKQARCDTSIEELFEKYNRYKEIK